MNDLEGLSALIIEPHSGMRASLHNMLNMLGLGKIVDAQTSNQAIKFLDRRSFDLVLCEYDLGGGQDGQQLLEDLRHNNLIALSTMFIMVTAENKTENVIAAKQAGVNNYIVKPFNAITLKQKIEAVIGPID